MADLYISPGTRAKYRPSAGAMNISMDFNASPNGGARGTEVVIPNNASPSVRAAAEQYNRLVAGFANKYGITDYPVRGVRTRAENKRGVPHTIHTEPFFNDDEAMQRAVQENPIEFAELYRSAFGGLANARLIAPHGVGKDRGAASSFFGDETSYGELMANSLLGQPPRATTSTQGSASMMQQQEEEKPRGLLGPLGIQKMEEGAEGETGQRFFQRDSFKDTAAILAQGFGRMGIMGMEEIADDIAKQRTENKARNKTIEYLRRSGRDDLADAVESGSLGARDAAGILFTKPKDDRTALMKNYAEYQRIFAEQGQEAADQFRAMSGGQTFNLGDQVGAESKLREKLMGKQGEYFASYLDAGAQSAAIMQDLDVLQELAPVAPSGPVVGRLAEMFPDLDDASALRQSIVKRVAPSLRVEGSGATSDLEFNAMLNSLGSLRNTPEANRAIIGIMQQKARYNMERRAIINKYMTDSASLAETNDALAALDVNSRIPDSVQAILSSYGVEAAAPAGGANTLTEEDMKYLNGDRG